MERLVPRILLAGVVLFLETFAPILGQACDHRDWLDMALPQVPLRV